MGGRTKDYDSTLIALAWAHACGVITALGSAPILDVQYLRASKLLCGLARDGFLRTVEDQVERRRNGPHRHYSLTRKGHARLVERATQLLMAS
jgi:hypothetical protein